MYEPCKHMKHLYIWNRICHNKDSEYPTVCSLKPPDMYFISPTELKRAIHMYQDFHTHIYKDDQAKSIFLKNQRSKHQNDICPSRINLICLNYLDLIISCISNLWKKTLLWKYFWLYCKNYSHNNKSHNPSEDHVYNVWLTQYVRKSP